MNVVIDRFEGIYAICEKPDRVMINIELRKLPSNVKEGDILVVDGDNIVVDVELTSERKKEIDKFMNQLWK